MKPSLLTLLIALLMVVAACSDGEVDTAASEADDVVDEAATQVEEAPTEADETADGAADDAGDEAAEELADADVDDALEELDDVELPDVPEVDADSEVCTTVAQLDSLFDDEPETAEEAEAAFVEIISVLESARDAAETDEVADAIQGGVDYFVEADAVFSEFGYDLESPDAEAAVSEIDQEGFLEFGLLISQGCGL